MVVITFFAVFLGTTLVQALWSRPISVEMARPSLSAEGRSALRLIHLVLDEHVGYEAIPVDTHAGLALKQTMKRFYERYGLMLYGRVHSHYYETYDSIPNMLNFSYEALPRALVEGEKPPHVLTRNAYFSWLQDNGLSVEVISAGYLGLCRHASISAERCKSYEFGSLQSLHALNVPATSKVPVLLGSYVTRYHRYHRALEAYDSLLQPALERYGLPAPRVPQDSLWTWNHLIPLSISAMAVLDQIWADIVSLPEAMHCMYIWCFRTLLLYTVKIARPGLFSMRRVCRWTGWTSFGVRENGLACMRTT